MDQHVELVGQRHGDADGVRRHGVGGAEGAVVFLAGFRHAAVVAGDGLGEALPFGDHGALVLNNAEWLAELRYIDFLRDIGRHFSVNRMLTFDSVRLRLEREQPLTFLEFNYMVLQAYDFVELYRRHGCRLQMGGSDQWGNIVNGVELGRRVDDRQLFGLTTRGEQIEVAINGERVALLEIDRFLSETDPSGLKLETEPIHVRAGPQRVAAAFLRGTEGPNTDLILPIDFTLADPNMGVGYGVTTLPHLRDLLLAQLVAVACLAIGERSQQVQVEAVADQIAGAPHRGLDFRAEMQAPVFATAPGKVTYAGWSGPFGRLVEIDHGHGIRTRYAHLKKILVKTGQTVANREKIGLVGSSGRSTGPHLHYEVRYKGVPLNPQKFLTAGKHVFKD